MKVLCRSSVAQTELLLLFPPEDENERMRLGFRGPQNQDVPLKHYRVSDWLSLLMSKTRLYYYNHAQARYAKKYLGENVWNCYFKFTFERNPFDKAISRYYWSTREINDQPIVIEDFLESVPVHLLSNWTIYTIDDEIAVDFVGRYESLTEDLATVGQKIGIFSELSLPHAKGNYRENRAHYSKVLSVRARTRIEEVCAKEIAALCYGWEDD